MAENSEIVEIAVALPVEGTYSYSVPPALAAAATPGKRVLVPFGNRRVTGFVLGEAAADDNLALKPLLGVMDEVPVFPGTMIPFFHWVSDYYMHPIGEVIRTALPTGITVSERTMIQATSLGKELLCEGGLEPEMAELLGKVERPVKASALYGRSRGPDVQRRVRELEQRGLLQRETRLTGGTAGHRKERIISLPDPPPDAEGLSAPRRSILQFLTQHGPTPIRRLREAVPTAPNLVRAMEKDGQVMIRWETVYRDPFGEPIPADASPELTAAQKEAVERVGGGLDAGFGAFLLSGVTGSGKTEVYLHSTGIALDRGKSALILVPEIALITQMERRFRARFGSKVAVLHSGLSAGERFDQWMRIAGGEALVVVGARSALFAPLMHLGLVVVDEEHDPSFKQETGLRYNARDMAMVRAKLSRAAVLLGSATPSVQSYRNARIGKLVEIELPERIEQRPLPQIEVVDLTESRDRRGADRFLTEPLRRAMSEVLARGEQVLLFLNRRGYASFPVCGSCGKPITCTHCDISLTFHQRINAFLCHYCGYRRPADTVCPACGADALRMLGLGTEKLHETIERLYPDARVARMDRDTTRRKGAILRLLRALRRGDIDVLVGTQMVAKGHDFPNITLVGIVCADLSLSFPDFRAGERTFQLLAQVAGRAGRGDRPGRVVLQTYNPNHFSIQAARDQDFRAFYRQEIEFRKNLGYPPFSRLVQVRFSGTDSAAVANLARDVGARLLENTAGRKGPVRILGPIESPLSRIAGRHRWQLLIKAAGAAALRRAVGTMMAFEQVQRSRQVRVTVDVDPVSML
jgi:primosomal protein N' (replication factor Y)